MINQNLKYIGFIFSILTIENTISMDAESIPESMDIQRENETKIRAYLKDINAKLYQIQHMGYSLKRFKKIHDSNALFVSITKVLDKEKGYNKEDFQDLNIFKRILENGKKAQEFWYASLTGGYWGEYTEYDLKFINYMISDINEIFKLSPLATNLQSEGQGGVDISSPVLSDLTNEEGQTGVSPSHLAPMAIPQNLEELSETDLENLYSQRGGTLPYDAESSERWSKQKLIEEITDLTQKLGAPGSLQSPTQTSQTKLLTGELLAFEPYQKMGISPEFLLKNIKGILTPTEQIMLIKRGESIIRDIVNGTYQEPKVPQLCVPQFLQAHEHIRHTLSGIFVRGGFHGVKEERMAYLEDIIAVVWALTNHAYTTKHVYMLSGAFNVIGIGADNLAQFFLNYMSKAGYKSKDITLLSNSALSQVNPLGSPFIYNRTGKDTVLKVNRSSHHTKTSNWQIGIDARCSSRAYTIPILPFGTKTILVAEALDIQNNPFTFIKYEGDPLGDLWALVEHAVTFATKESGVNSEKMIPVSVVTSFKKIVEAVPVTEPLLAKDEFINKIKGGTYKLVEGGSFVKDDAITIRQMVDYLQSLDESIKADDTIEELIKAFIQTLQEANIIAPEDTLASQELRSRTGNEIVIDLADFMNPTK